MIRKSMKKAVLGIVCAVFLMMSAGCSAVSSITVGGYTSDEPCAWCGETPTKEFKTSGGDPCYICEEHTHECGVCGKNFDKELNHYTNLMGIETFVCDDCYQDVQDMNQN